MGLISNLGAHENKLHPKIVEAIRALDSGGASLQNYGLNWLLTEQLKMKDGTAYRIVDSFRSPAEQTEKVKAGLSHAPPFASYHNWGLAFDIIPRKTGYDKTKINPMWTFDPGNKVDVLQLGIPQFFEQRGLEAGVRWVDFFDPWHLELVVPVPKDKRLAGTAWWTRTDIDLVPIEWHKDNPETEVVATLPHSHGGAGLPDWLLPVALGVAAVVGALLIFLSGRGHRGSAR